MMANAFKAVCAGLKRADFTQSIDMCCVCLENVGLYGIAIEDEIELGHFQGHHLQPTRMSSILKSLMNESYYEIMQTLSSVCKDCTSSAIAAYKFIQCCIEKSKLLRTAMEQLENSFQDVTLLEDTCRRSLYVAIQPNIIPDKSVIKRYYDNKILIVPQDTAFQRFMMITGNNTKKMDEIRAENDTTEVDLSEQDNSLLCCRVNFDTKELLNDPDNPLEYKCKFCKELFAKSSSLRTHFYRVHRKSNLKCKDCTKLYQMSELSESETVRNPYLESPLRTPQNRTSRSVQSDSDYDVNHPDIEKVNENRTPTPIEFLVRFEMTSSELSVAPKNPDSHICVTENEEGIPLPTEFVGVAISSSKPGVNNKISNSECRLDQENTKSDTTRVAKPIFECKDCNLICKTYAHYKKHKKNQMCKTS